MRQRNVNILLRVISRDSEKNTLPTLASASMASSMSWTLSLYFFQKISRPGVRSNRSCRKTEKNVKEQIHSGEEVIFSSDKLV